jgi:hypothetical protein
MKIVRGRRAALATIPPVRTEKETIMDRDHDAEASF